MSEKKKRDKFIADMTCINARANGAWNLELLFPDEVAYLAPAALCGDRNAGNRLVLIAEWMTSTAARKTGDETLCLMCANKFSREIPPLAFAMLMPFTSTEGAIVSGVCRDCCTSDRGDVLARAFSTFKLILLHDAVAITAAPGHA